MKIQSIVIVLEPEEGMDHATLLKFEHGTWTMNGPVFPRIASAMSEIIQLIGGNRVPVRRK